MYSLRLAALAVATLLLCGCATIIDGTNQEVSFNSNPSGAKCELERKREIIGRFETPQTINIKKTKHDINVTCNMEGFHESKGFMKSKIEDATWGNIVLGGLIGWGIDSATGSDNKYEKYITITMVPLAQPAPPPLLPLGKKEDDPEEKARKPDAPETQPERPAKLVPVPEETPKP